MALLLLRLAVSEILKSSDRGKSLNKGKLDILLFFCSAFTDEANIERAKEIYTFCFSCLYVYLTIDACDIRLHKNTKRMFSVIVLSNVSFSQAQQLKSSSLFNNIII